MKYASERRSAGGQISRYGSRDYGGIMKYREQFFYIGKKIVVFLCSLLVLSVLFMERVWRRCVWSKKKRPGKNWD